MTTKRRLRLRCERLCRVLMKPVYCIFGMKSAKLCRLCLDYLHTCWCASGLASLGYGAIIHRHSNIVGGKYLSIGNMTSIGCYATVSAWDRYYDMEYRPSISIGHECDFGEYLHISCISEIRIGNGVLTGRWVTITDNSHGLPTEENSSVIPAVRQLYSKGPVIIGNNVWIGDKVTILPGTVIGDGAVIGAGSVVKGNVAPNDIVAGIPARSIKMNGI